MSAKNPPRVEFVSGLAWIALGGAIVYGSWTMDRLEKLHINPYTAPGLVPGILGAFIALFGLIMAIRAWRDGAFAAGAVPLAAMAPSRDMVRRTSLSLALCLGFGLGLIGRGPPFWLGAGLFLFLHIYLFDRLDEPVAPRGEMSRIVKALAVAVAVSAVVTLIFQEFFLVRLP